MNDSSRYSAETVESLILAFKTHPASTYQTLRHATRTNYDTLCKRLAREHGSARIADLTASTVREWHEHWKRDGREVIAHGLIQMLRGLTTFGVVHLENAHCRELRVVLQAFRFPRGGTPRETRITAEQVQQIISVAHELGFGSIALTQAIQFDCHLGQKDTIGEWVPLSDPRESDVVDDARKEKWVGGLRWSNIDDTLTLRHTRSRTGQRVEVSLDACPLVTAELKRVSTNRQGPVILFEATGRPYLTHQFRRTWREVANFAGLPTTLKNSDSGPRQLARHSERDTAHRMRILISGLESIRDFRNCHTADAMSAVAARTLTAAEVRSS